MIDQPTAEGALRALDPLVGEWRLTAVGPGGEPWPGEARSTFEWHASGAHLVQTTTIEMPEAPDNTSIIGCDVANGTYYQLYSDERGVCRVYGMSISEEPWSLWREEARGSSAALHREVRGRRPATSPVAGRRPRTASTTRPKLLLRAAYARVGR